MNVRSLFGLRDPPPPPLPKESNLKVSTACNLITAAALSYIVSPSCVVLTPIVNKMISYGASYGVGKAKEEAAKKATTAKKRVIEAKNYVTKKAKEVKKETYELLGGAKERAFETIGRAKERAFETIYGAEKVAAVGKYILSTAKPFAAIILLSPSLLTVSGVLLNAAYETYQSEENKDFNIFVLNLKSKFSDVKNSALAAWTGSKGTKVIEKQQLIPDSKKSSEDIQWRKIASVISFGLIPLAFKIYESILVPLASKINDLVFFKLNDFELFESGLNNEPNLANPSDDEVELENGLNNEPNLANPSDDEV